MAATLKDVAEKSRVHLSTVSRVLNRKENFRISSNTRDRIFAVAKELDYHPNQNARALRLKE